MKNQILRRNLPVIIGIIISSTVFTAYATTKAQDTLSEGLILRYTFDAAIKNDQDLYDTIPDMSGNGNHATVLNGTNAFEISDGVGVFPGFANVISTTPSEVRYGVVDFGSVLQMPDNINEGIEDFTFSFWIKAAESYNVNSLEKDLTSSYQGIFNFGTLAEGANYNVLGGDYSADAYWNEGSNLNTRFTMNAIFGGSGNPLLRINERMSNENQDFISTNFYRDAWHFITVVYQKNGIGEYEVHLYLDGEALYLDTPKKSLYSLKDYGDTSGEKNANWIGRMPWTIAQPVFNPDFKGQMDEIRLYNRALSDGEVLQLMQTTYYGIHRAMDVEIVSGDGSATVTLNNGLTEGKSIICILVTYTQSKRVKNTEVKNAFVEPDEGSVFNFEYSINPGEIVRIVVWEEENLEPYAVRTLEH